MQTSKIIRTFLERLREGNTKNMSLRELDMSINQFHWALIKKYEVPVIWNNKVIDVERTKCTLKSPWVSEADLAVIISKRLLNPEYAMRGVWDQSRTFEEQFIEVKPASIPDKFFNNIDWGKQWIAPKERLFLFPFEIAAAIVGNVIFCEPASFPGATEKNKAEIAAQIGVSLVQSWYGTLFDSGKIFESSDSNFQNYESFLDQLFFLNKDFREHSPYFCE